MCSSDLDSKRLDWDSKTLDWDSKTLDWDSKTVDWGKVVKMMVHHVVAVRRQGLHPSGREHISPYHLYPLQPAAGALLGPESAVWGPESALLGPESALFGS